MATNIASNIVTNHVIVPITPNIRPPLSIYIQRQKRTKSNYICNCSSCETLKYRFNRLSTTQKYLVVLSIIILLLLLGGFGVAMYVGIQLCVYAC